MDLVRDRLAIRREVARPELIDLTHLDWRFGDPDSPAIAVISHSPGVGIPLTRRLRVEFAVGGLKVAPMPELVCEPGYHFDGSQGTPTGGSSTPQVQHLAQMAGVVVVLALDDQLNDATYDSIAPQHATTIKAYRGRGSSAGWRHHARINDS